MARRNFPIRKEQRKEEALKRQAIRNKRTSTEQLAELNRRVGENGAKKERSRITPNG